MFESILYSEINLNNTYFGYMNVNFSGSLTPR